MFDFIVDKQMFAVYNTKHRTVVRANKCSIQSILVYNLFLGVYTVVFYEKGVVIMKRNMRSTSTKKKIRRARNLFLGMIAAVLMCSMSFGVFLVSAHESGNAGDSSYTYYTSIEIRPGDTLWAIAEEHMTDDYDSVAEYVQVLMKMNQLDSDEIYSGQNLIIAYNDSEFK